VSHPNPILLANILLLYNSTKYSSKIIYLWALLYDVLIYLLWISWSSIIVKVFTLMLARVL